VRLHLQETNSAARSEHLVDDDEHIIAAREDLVLAEERRVERRELSHPHWFRPCKSGTVVL
jgi:hypothetical protein